MKDTNKEEEQHQKSKIIDVKESIEGKEEGIKKYSSKDRRFYNLVVLRPLFLLDRGIVP